MQFIIISIPGELFELGTTLNLEEGKDYTILDPKIENQIYEESECQL